MEGQCLRRGYWSHRQQTQGPLRELWCVNKRKDPASHGSCSLLKHTKSSIHVKGNSAKSQALFLFFFLNGLN